MRIRRGVTASIQSVGTPTVTMVLAVIFVSLAVTQASGQTKSPAPIAPCCSIVSINGIAGTATAKNKVTGRLVTFRVADKTMLQGLRIGQSIYVDSQTQKVSLNPGEPCCNAIPPQEVRAAATSALPPSDARARATSGVGEASGHQPTPGTPCCGIVGDAALNSHIGRIVAHFPAVADLGHTNVEVLKAGTNERVGGWYGSGQLEVAPGTYDLKISNKILRGVVVQGGHDTDVKVGVIHLKAGGSTWSDILDSDAAKTEITGGYAVNIGLPAGTYNVKMGAVTQPVVVQAGKVTEF